MKSPTYFVPLAVHIHNNQKELLVQPCAPSMYQFATFNDEKALNAYFKQLSVSRPSEILGKKTIDNKTYQFLLQILPTAQPVPLMEWRPIHLICDHTFNHSLPLIRAIQFLLHDTAPAL